MCYANELLSWSRNIEYKVPNREITQRLPLISSTQVNNCELKKLVETSRTLITMKVSKQLLLPIFFFLSLRCPRHRRLLVIVPVSPSVNIPIIHSGIVHASCYNYSFDKTAERKFPSSCQDSNSLLASITQSLLILLRQRIRLSRVQFEFLHGP